MVRARRAAGARTPYERPRLTNPAPQNPNWLSRLIYSPTRSIATGAGKLLSTVFFPEAESDSESSSTSSSSDDSSSGKYKTNSFFFFLNYLGGEDVISRFLGFQVMANVMKTVFIVIVFVLWLCF
jgi:hypothetical protein